MLERLREWRLYFVEMMQEPWGEVVVGSLLEYIFQVGKVEPEEVGECLRGTPGVEETIMTTAQRLIEQGRREGQRGILLKLLRLRFGSMSDQAMARINEASAEQLERWAERVITANALEEAPAD